MEMPEFARHTDAALRDFLRDGIIRNAVNVPSVSAEEFSRLRPFVDLGERGVLHIEESSSNLLGITFSRDWTP